MIPVMNDLRRYLEITGKGYKVKANCPPNKLEELQKMNEEYKKLTGETLINFKSEG